MRYIFDPLSNFPEIIGNDSWERLALINARYFQEHDDFSLPIKRSDPNNAHSFVATDSLLALTPFGELYIHQILPLNRKTADRIEKISKKVGEGYEQFALFPDKRKQ